MANPEIRPAGVNDIDAICNLLHSKMNRKIQPERWAKLMTYDWLSNKPDLGRVIESDNTILGYLGMVYSEREINNKREQIVNICAWYLDKSLRGLGLGKGIMADATSDPSKSYTIMTSSKNTLDILDEVGYKILDDSSFFWIKEHDQDSSLKLNLDIKQIRSALSSPVHKKLFDDHIQYEVKPLLVQHKEKYCLLFLSVKRKAQDVLFFDVLFASDREFLGIHGQQIANALLPSEPSVFSADQRFVQGQAIHSSVKSLPVPRFYKSSKLQPKDIDHLYTELQLLDLKLD